MTGRGRWCSHGEVRRAGLPYAHEDFHAFVFSSDGICIAHGREPSFVGKALQQVFANEEIEDSADMHERFLRAAAAGGGWCTYLSLIHI